MAERVGFEPTLEFPLNTLSKRAPSTTRPSLPWEHCNRRAPRDAETYGIRLQSNIRCGLWPPMPNRTSRGEIVSSPFTSTGSLEDFFNLLQKAVVARL